MSVNDSTDLAYDNLVDIAKEMGIVRGEEQQLNGTEHQFEMIIEPLQQGRVGGMQQLVVGSKGWVSERQMENDPLVKQEERERVWSDASDYEFAQQLQENEQEAQLERDRELAEQLQLKENSYRTPVYVTC